NFSLDTCLREAEACFERGIPAIVSVHSINFHSTVCDFRTSTLTLLDQFLFALQTKYPNLLYLHDEDIYELVNKGSHETSQGTVQVNVTRKKFTKASVARGEKA